MRNPDIGDLRFQVTRFRRRLRPFKAPHQNAEFVAADTADDVGCPNVANQLAGDRLEQRIAGAMAVTVIDRP